MEQEGLLTCSQQPANGPHPEPDPSSPHLPALLPILKVFSHQRLALPSSLLLSGYPTIILYLFLTSSVCIM